MFGSSFRLLSGQFLPCRGRCKQRNRIAAAVLALALAGCGGQGGRSETATRRVSGNGFAFSAPAEWKLTRVGQRTSASPGGDSPELIAVETFRLTRAYRPALWPRVVPELDGVARTLAARLGGTLAESRSVIMDGRRARQYQIHYTSGKTPLTQRITFVLAGRREYQLSCRWRTDSPGLARAACDRFAFRLT
jgi:hypothetical protein